jgi:hypothetical protein
MQCRMILFNELNIKYKISGVAQRTLIFARILLTL